MSRTRKRLLLLTQSSASSQGDKSARSAMHNNGAHDKQDTLLLQLPEFLKINILKRLGIQYLGRVQVNKKLCGELQKTSRGENTYDYWLDQYQFAFPRLSEPTSTITSSSPAYTAYRKRRVRQTLDDRLRYHILCHDLVEVKKLQLEQLPYEELFHPYGDINSDNLKLANVKDTNIFRYLYSLSKLKLVEIDGKINGHTLRGAILRAAAKYGVLEDVCQSYEKDGWETDSAYGAAVFAHQHEVMAYFLSQDKKYVNNAIYGITGTMDRITPLSFAVKTSDNTMCELLHRHDASIAPSEDNNLICAAAQSNNIDTLNMVLSWYATESEDIELYERIDLAGALAIAVANYNRLMCNRLREVGANVCIPEKDEKWHLLAHLAARHDDPLFMQTVLSWYPTAVRRRVLGIYHGKYQPIHIAAHCNCSKLIAYFYNLDPNSISASEDDSPPPLVVAASRGNAQAVRQLIALHQHLAEQLQQNNDFLNTHYDDGYTTPLVEVTANCDVECVSSLLSAGADVNLTCRNGYSALHAAAEHGKADAALLLIQHGAILTGQSRITAEDAADSDSFGTPLEIAITNLNVDCVRDLLEAGAPVDQPTEPLEEEDGLKMFPLRRVQLLRYEMRRFFLLDEDEENETRMLAEITYLLIKHGTPLLSYCRNQTKYGYSFMNYAPVYEKNGDNYIPTNEFMLLLAGEIAIERGNELVIKRLINELAAPVNTCWGLDTPLYSATAANQVHLVRLLITSGANVNLTPASVHYAIEIPELPARSPFTPLQIAAAMGDVQMVLLLLMNGADPMIALHGTVSALELAQREGHVEVIALLEAWLQFDAHKSRLNEQSLFLLRQLIIQIIKTPYLDDHFYAKSGQQDVTFFMPISARKLLLMLATGFIPSIEQLKLLLEDYQDIIHTDKYHYMRTYLVAPMLLLVQFANVPVAIQ